MNNEINIENNNINKDNKRNKVILILIVILILVVLSVSTYLIIKSNKKNKIHEETTTFISSESSSKSSSTQATSTPIDVLERNNIRKATKSDTYTKVINNKEYAFNFYYYFEETKGGYNYILSIYEDDAFLNRYIIGFGLTKEKAENKKDNSNYRPNYSIDMLTTIKDKSNDNEYIVYLIPSYIYTSDDNKTGVFITTPTIRRDNGVFIKTIKTTYGTLGYSFVLDSKYGFSHELVNNNHGSYRIDDNKIYYTDISECNKEKMNLSILEINDGKESITKINDLEIDGAGHNC